MLPFEMDLPLLTLAVQVSEAIASLVPVGEEEVGKTAGG